MSDAATPQLQAKRPALRRHIIALAVILILCVGIFLWVGATYLPDGIGRSERVLVNDDYSVAQGPLSAGDELRQDMVVQGELYGVVLDVATYGRVAQGTLHLRLVDDAGNVVAQNDTDMTTLLDNTFHGFAFDAPVDAGSGARYTLVITSSPATAEDVLGFWRSDGPARDIVTPKDATPTYDLRDFTLAENGATVDGTLALQYLTAYSGDFIIGAYAFFSAVLTAFFLLLYVLLFVRKTPVHRIVLFCALVLGSVFLFLIPPRTAPDEYVHIASTYHNTNVLFGQPELGAEGSLTVRAGDEMMLENYDYDGTGIFAYQDMYENLFARAPGGDAVVIPARVSNFFPPLYFVQTLGVALARLFGFGRVGLLLCGRLANLIFYAVVLSRAVKRMPVAKPLLACLGLLPMCLQLAASFSYDTYVIALSFYFIALCLQYAYRPEGMSVKNAVALGILALLLAPAKTVYLLLVPLVLFIPAAKYQTRKQCIISRVSVLAAAVAFWAVFNLAGVQTFVVRPFTTQPVAETTVSATETVEGAGVDLAVSTQNGTAPEDAAAPSTEGSSTAAEPEAPANTRMILEQTGEEIEIAPNGDAIQKFTPTYILRHIPHTAQLLGQTIWEQGPLWLQGTLGGRLGEIIAIHIEINWIFVIGLLFVLCLAAVPDPRDRIVLDLPRRLASLAIALAVSALFIFACITWTPINYTNIFGVQGRYFLPVLPLVFLAARGTNLHLRKPLVRPLLFAMSALVVLCQLDAFTTIIKM